MESMESFEALGHDAATTDCPHNIGGSKGIADISEGDNWLLNAREVVQDDPSMSLTEAPKSADLMGWFSVACLIANRMIGMMDPYSATHTD